LNFSQSVSFSTGSKVALVPTVSRMPNITGMWSQSRISVTVTSDRHCWHAPLVLIIKPQITLHRKHHSSNRNCKCSHITFIFCKLNCFMGCHYCLVVDVLI
jgi:hypothetical protein